MKTACLATHGWPEHYFHSNSISQQCCSYSKCWSNKETDVIVFHRRMHNIQKVNLRSFKDQVIRMFSKCLSSTRWVLLASLQSLQMQLPTDLYYFFRYNFNVSKAAVHPQCFCLGILILIKSRNIYLKQNKIKTLVFWETDQNEVSL